MKKRQKLQKEITMRVSHFKGRTFTPIEQKPREIDSSDWQRQPRELQKVKTPKDIRAAVWAGNLKVHQFS